MYTTALREQLGIQRSQWLARAPSVESSIDALIGEIIQGPHEDAEIAASFLSGVGWSREQANLPAIAIDLAEVYLRLHSELARGQHIGMFDRLELSTEHDKRSVTLVLGDLCSVSAYAIIAGLPTPAPANIQAALGALTKMMQRSTEADILDGKSRDLADDLAEQSLNAREVAIALVRGAVDGDKLKEAMNHAIQDVL